MLPENGAATVVDRRGGDDEIDLRQYVAIVMRYRWSIIGLALVLSLLAALISFSLRPVYSATATLMIESKEANVVSIEDVYGLDTSRNEYFLTQFEILKSRELAEAVIRRLDLAKHAEFDPLQNRSPFSIYTWVPPWLLTPPEPTEAQLWRATVDLFMDNLAVVPVRRTQLVKIVFRSHDPDLSHRIANELGAAYIDAELEARVDVTRQAAEWLTDRLSGLRDQLQASEQRLQAYKEQEQLVDVEGVTTLNARELDQLTTEAVEARKARADVENQYRQVQGTLPERLEFIPIVLENKVVQALKASESDAELRVAELAKRYGPKHPKMIAAQSELSRARETLRQQVIKVADGFREEYEQAVANERSTAAALEAAKGDIQQIGRKRYELNELQREVDTNRRLYDLFFTRFRETNATDFQAVNARLIDPAVRPFDPVAPRKKLIVGLTFVGSLVMGVLLAFVRELLDATLKSAGEVAERLNVTLLGVLPLMRNRQRKKLRSSMAFIDPSENGFSEATRTIRTAVNLAGMSNPHKTIVVTSSVPGEGKTTLASNLAIALAQMESVLLIDADMRRPSIAKDFGMSNATNGLADIVAGNESFEDCVYRIEEAGIDVITAGHVPPNPLELLSSPQFKVLLGELGERYDRIVIDSAPAQAVSDALVLSTLADGLIYVIRADHTPVHLAQSGIGRLREVSAPLLGVVLNQVDGSKRRGYGYGSYYGYYGYHGYYDSYGYSSDNARAAGEPERVTAAGS